LIILKKRLETVHRITDTPLVVDFGGTNGEPTMKASNELTERLEAVKVAWIEYVNDSGLTASEVLWEIDCNALTLLSVDGVPLSEMEQIYCRNTILDTITCMQDADSKPFKQQQENQR